MKHLHPARIIQTLLLTVLAAAILLAKASKAAVSVSASAKIRYTYYNILSFHCRSTTGWGPAVWYLTTASEWYSSHFCGTVHALTHRGSTNCGRRTPVMKHERALE